jgi:hypothetical protein
MRRVREDPPTLLGAMLSAWQAVRDPRATALRAGRAVELSVDELPTAHPGASRDRVVWGVTVLGFPDDFVLYPDGELEHTLAYWRRRLEPPAMAEQGGS